MFCKNCGNQVSEGAKFCAKCGYQRASSVSIDESKKSSRLLRSTITFLVEMVILSLLIYWMALSNWSEKYGVQPIIGFIMIIIVVVYLGVLIFNIRTLISGIKKLKNLPANIKKTIAYFVQRPAKSISISVVLMAVIVAMGLLFNYYSNRFNEKYIAEALPIIQEGLSEVAAAKLAGDTLAANQKNVPASFNWQKVQDVANNVATLLDDLQSNYRLSEYKKAGIAWAEKIRDAAKGQNNWKNVPEAPADFTIVLKEKEAEKLFNNSLVKIFELIRFGTNAIERNDKETMRYIAARLLVQDHWLNGLVNYEKTWVFANSIGLAYAAEEENVTVRLIKKSKKRQQEYELAHLATKNLTEASYNFYIAKDVKKDRAAAQKWFEVLLDTTAAIARRDLTSQVLVELTSTNDLIGASYNFYVARDVIKDRDAAAKWAKVVMDTMSAITQLDLGSQVLIELSKASENFKATDQEELKLIKEIPKEKQEFNENCIAKGGALSEASSEDRTMAGLPTLEKGTKCTFKKEQSDCWGFMTYSGSSFSGGDYICDKKNLLPDDLKDALNKGELSSKSTTPPTAPKTTVPKTTAPKTTTPAPAPLRDLGQPTGTAAPKIEFVLLQSNFTARVGERFSYSFCQPPVTRTSDLCTAASTNPRYGLPPYSFYVESGTTLPFGLSLNLNGLLIGTPTAEGSRTVGICAKDTGGFFVCRKITINVEPRKVVYPYDGIYSVTCSSTARDNCCINGSIEAGLPDSYRETFCIDHSTGEKDSFHVTENILDGRHYSKGVVNASGEAQTVYNYGSYHAVTTYKFSRSENGEIQVNATENSTRDDWGYNCTKTWVTKCSGRKVNY